VEWNEVKGRQAKLRWNGGGEDNGRHRRGEEEMAVLDTRTSGLETMGGGE